MADTQSLQLMSRKLGLSISKDGGVQAINLLLREAGTSVLEILKVDVVSSVYIPIQVTSP
ncbi:hypothetical protein NC651_005944 [Populus alba x Populus x berolinensis]|nr:hypothetical protein NC651_005944 [Populus alba x Populus x berolinensis]